MISDPNAFDMDAMLCDSAVAVDGKLYLQGAGWENLNTAALPFRVPRIGIAMVLRVPYTQTNKNHSLSIKMIGEDSDKPIPLGLPVPDGQGGMHAPAVVNAQFAVGRPPTLMRGESQAISLALNLDQMVFTEAGSYSFHFEIAGEEIKRLHFRVLTPTGVNVM